MTSWPVYRRTLRILGIVTALLITLAVALLPGGIGALTNPTGRLALAEAEGAQHTSTAYTFHPASSCSTTDSALWRTSVADWPQFGYTSANTRCQPFETRLSPKTVPHLVLGWRITSAAFGSAIPAIVNGVVYAPSEYPDNTLYAFNAATGATRWSAPIPTIIGTNPSAPAVAQGRVYINVNDTLYTFSAATGAPGWSFATGGFLTTPPVVNDGVVYIASQDEHLYALRASSGAVLWSATIAGSFVASPISVADGVVYLAAGQALEAFTAKTGALRWSVAFPVSSSGPVYANGYIYIGGFDFKVYALDAKTGAVVWAAATGNVVNASVAVDRSTVYVGSGDGKFYAFNAKTGALRWSADTNPGDLIFAAAAVANGVVYVGSACDCGADTEHHLFAYNAATGALLWSYAPGYPVYTAPDVANGTLYFGTHTGLDTFRVKSH